MDKRGAMQLKADNDEICRQKAIEYLSALPQCEPYRMAYYRTDRGADYGVIVNVGEKVSVWNAFTGKVIQYYPSDLEGRKLPVKEKDCIFTRNSL